LLTTSSLLLISMSTYLYVSSSSSIFCAVRLSIFVSIPLRRLVISVFALSIWEPRFFCALFYCNFDGIYRVPELVDFHVCRIESRRYIFELFLDFFCLVVFGLSWNVAIDVYPVFAFCDYYDRVWLPSAETYVLLSCVFSSPDVVVDSFLLINMIFSFLMFSSSAVILWYPFVSNLRNQNTCHHLLK